MNDGKKSRRRRSSSLIYQEPPESLEHMSDQSALPNVNADWVNAKGNHILSMKSLPRGFEKATQDSLAGSDSCTSRSSCLCTSLTRLSSI